MRGIDKPLSPFRWDDFIRFTNSKFNMELPAGASIQKLDTSLDPLNKKVFFRIWLLGEFAENPDHFNPVFKISNKFLLLRNFFSCMGSLNQYGKKYIPTVKKGLNYFEYILKQCDPGSDIILYYEDIIEDPLRLNELFAQVGTKTLSASEFSGFKEFEHQTITGDYKILKTSGIKKSTKYYKFQFDNDLYDYVLNRIKKMDTFVYIGLTNPPFPAIVAHFIHHKMRLFWINLKMLLKMKRK